MVPGNQLRVGTGNDLPLQILPGTGLSSPELPLVFMEPFSPGLLRLWLQNSQFFASTAGPRVLPVTPCCARTFPEVLRVSVLGLQLEVSPRARQMP